jgi:hypothetical protein
VSRPRMTLVTLGLLACATGAAPAGPLATQTAPALGAGPNAPVRFEISHAAGGRPGPPTSPDGKWTVKVVGDLQALVVEAGSGRPAGPVLRHSQRRDGMRLHAWAFSPDGRLLATASSEGEGEDTVGEVRVWEVVTGRLVAVATDAGYELGRIATVAFSEDGKAVLIHCEDISGK